MIVSRKDFKFQPVPTDRQLWAIGMVAVQWSGLETLIRACIHGIAGGDKAVRDEYDATQSTRRRLDYFEALVDARMMEPYRATMIAFIHRIKGAQGERDKIVHASWSSDPNNIQNPDYAKAFSFGGPAKVFEWKLTYAKIVEVAKKIDGLQNGLMGLVFAFSPPGSDNLMLSNALQRTLHKQYRSA